jgi:uncharacterized protein (TIGR00162 family)
MTVEIRILQKPDLKKPTLICGLPGSGYVGKLAVDHLVSELNAIPIGEVYSSSFPPQIMIKPDGTSEPMKNVLYASKGSNSRADFLIFTGDSQPVFPDANYEISDRVVELAHELGTETIFTLAAYITGGFVNKPKVYGTATTIELAQELEKKGVVKMSEGTITGMNGVLIGVAKKKGLVGASLLGETSGYIIDAKASQAVLEVLSQLLNIQFSMATLDSRAKETESVIQTIEQMRRRSQENPIGKGEQPESGPGYIS